MFRVGLGYDNHRLEPGLKLWIGGVEIASPVGAVAHSDGDVLLHALTDALLGAVAAGDIGELFPDTDDVNKGRASDIFVRAAADAVRDRGFDLVNVDATVILEKVKLSPYKLTIAERIRVILADHWDLDETAVNIKAKTNERCDAVGSGDAVVAQVAVLVQRR